MVNSTDLLCFSCRKKGKRDLLHVHPKLPIWVSLCTCEIVHPVPFCTLVSLSDVIDMFSRQQMHQIIMFILSSSRISDGLFNWFHFLTFSLIYIHDCVNKQP